MRPGPQETLIPETPVYRVRLAPESILRRVWNIVLGVLIRESGF